MMTDTINAELVGKCDHCDIIAENAELVGQQMMSDSNEKSLQLENLALRSEIHELKKDINLLKNEIDKIKIKQDKPKLDALVQLNKYNLVVERNVRREYMIWTKFKSNWYDIPSIIDFINNPPNKNNDPNMCEFWEYFKNKFPKITDECFQDLYLFISNQCSQSGAYSNINKMDINKMLRSDFDEAAKIVFDDYDTNKNLYDEYRKCIFSFPIIF